MILVGIPQELFWNEEI